MQLANKMTGLHYVVQSWILLVLSLSSVTLQGCPSEEIAKERRGVQCCLRKFNLSDRHTSPPLSPVLLSNVQSIQNKVWIKSMSSRSAGVQRNRSSCFHRDLAEWGQKWFICQQVWLGPFTRTDILSQGYPEACLYVNEWYCNSIVFPFILDDWNHCWFTGILKAMSSSTVAASG